MKVLWFSPTPSLASDYYNSKTKGGGWMQGLESAIGNFTDWKLAIAFHTESNKDVLVKNSIYYPIKKRFNFISKLINNHFSIIEKDKYLSEYISIINQFKPDIIEIFGTENSYIEMLPHITNIPVLIHIQGILTDYKNYFYKGYSALDILKYSSLSNYFKGNTHLHLFKNFKKRATREEKYAQYCHFYLGRTEYDRNFVLKYAPDSKYYVCNELLRDEFYSADAWNSSYKDKLIMLSTNNGELYKGIDIIFETASKLKAQNIDFEWRIAGVSDSDFVIKFFAKKLNLKYCNINIKLLGRLNPSQLIDEMYKCNLFVHPSRIDNSPNSVCEAQILGMPVLASNTGGIPSLIDDGNSGFLTEVNPISFTNSIIKITQNYDDAIKIGSNGRLIALKRHSKETTIYNLKEIYNKILENK